MFLFTEVFVNVMTALPTRRGLGRRKGRKGGEQGEGGGGEGREGGEREKAVNSIPLVSGRAWPREGGSV